MTQKTFKIDRDFDSILSEWKVQSESERWSLKTMFLQEYPDDYTYDDFENFLKEKLGKDRRSGRM